jgi:HemY protein
MPVSPVTGRLDAFTWMEPLAQIGGSAGPGHVIEVEEPAAIQAPAMPAVQGVPEIAATQPPSPTAPEPPRPEVSPAPSIAARTATPPAQAANFEKVIPLIHAPDDPGPDGEPQTEPLPDPPPPASNGWDRLRALFK